MKDYIKIGALLILYSLIITISILKLKVHIDYDFSFLISIFIAFGIAYFSIIRSNRTLIIFGRIELNKIIKYLGLTFILIGFSLLYYYMVYDFNISFFEWNKEQKSFTMILLNLFIAPITEEIIYRGLAIEYLKHRGHSLVYTSIFISVLFGLFHSYNIVLMFLFGIVFSVVYLRERNLIYPILIHSVYNLSTYLVAFN